MGKSKKSIPEKAKLGQFNKTFNRHFSNRGNIYKMPDRSNSQFPRPTFNNVYARRQDYRYTYSHYRPYYASNEAHLKNRVYKKPPSRPSSPTLGSEEYMVRKIQQTSASIMKQLLNPNEQVVVGVDEQTSTPENKEDCATSINKNANKTLDKPTETIENKNKKKVVTSYNIEEIHKKIIDHITNMNDGKKKNLVLSNTSSYDIAIQQIQKQKRLDISRALRNMCSQSVTQESSDFINSIIPDMGIKIEDLPHNLIEELTNTLNLESESSNYEDHFLNLVTQASAFSSSGKTQLYGDTSGENNLSMNNSLGDNGPNLQTYIKSEYTNDALFLSIYDKGSSSVNEGIEINSENAENITIKKEIDQYSVDSCINNTQASNEIIQSSVPTTSREMCGENTENNINVKQEYTENEEYPENYQSNIEVLNEPFKSPDELNTDVLDIGISSNSLPICGESKNNMIKNEPKDVIEISDDEFYNPNGQEHLSFFSPPKETLDISIQTDEIIYDTPEALILECLSKGAFKNEPTKTITEAVNRMFKIDECISKLTKYRQALFRNLKNQDNVNASCKETSSNLKTKVKKKKKGKSPKNPENVVNTKKRKLDESINDTNKGGKSEAIHATGNNENNCCKKQCSGEMENKGDKLACDSIAEIRHQKLLSFEEIQEKILVIQAVEDKLVTATESGKIFVCSLENGHHTNVLQVSNVPITALWFQKISKQHIEMYVGSLEANLKIYDFHNGILIKTVNIDDSIQCLESNWGYIFMGCIRGTLMRYSIKKSILEYDDKLSDDRILVIKATQEGARKILLVGSRNSPVCIRDAMTGLYMRTMENVISPTVYSLIMEKSLVYCGTTNHDILVYSFHDGKLINSYKVSSSKGISCLKIIKNLLFASCHNGNIYVYNIKTNRFIDSIQGPGGVILSMEVLENQVIVGTMSFKFKSLPIPHHILRCNSD